MTASRALKTFAGLALFLAFAALHFATQPQTTSSPLPASAYAAISIKPATTTPDVYPVLEVVDGDTIDILLNGTTTRIRIIGMDTPELYDPRKPVQCFAKEASAEAHRLLEGQYVRLEYQPDDRIDKYGRTLAYVFLLDGRNYEKFMIQNGFAHEYTYKKSYKYQKEFRAAEAEAKAALRGFWALDTCAGNTTKPAVAK